jgi:hypothetical protein
MKSIPSSQFRVNYQSLLEETEVTVHGHVIGRWVPSGARAMGEVFQPVVSDNNVVIDGQMRLAASRLPGGHYRPVPKPTSKKPARKRR